ncbi:MAG: OsmC family protein [Bacteroidota bacterium]
MHIVLEHRKNFRFTATTDNGKSVEIDASSAAGEAEHASPMQLVASAIGACSAIDIVDILQKGRQTIDSFSIEVDAERAETPPKVFTRVHVHYDLNGDLTSDKVQRAIALSLQKYCSVSIMIAKTATLTASCSVNGERSECKL